MTSREEAVQFGANRCLVGILTEPEPVRVVQPGFLLLNAGITHRIGPNRLYVRLAREIAARGFSVLRYDASMLGDSRIAVSSLASALEPDPSTEPQQAMDWFDSARGIDRFVLMGMCSGADAAFRTARADPRVVGVVLLGTPPPKGEMATRVLARHLWRIAFRSSFRAKKWRKLLHARFDRRRALGAVRGLLTGAAFRCRSGPSPSALDEYRGATHSLIQRGVRLLFVHAEADEGLDFTELVFEDEIREERWDDRCRLMVVPGADHTFTLLSSQQHLLDCVLPWVERTLAEEVRRPRRTGEG